MTVKNKIILTKNILNYEINRYIIYSCSFVRLLSRTARSLQKYYRHKNSRMAVQGHKSPIKSQLIFNLAAHTLINSANEKTDSSLQGKTSQAPL